MSIVEETLNRLQASKSAADGQHPVEVPAELGQFHDTRSPGRTWRLLVGMGGVLAVMGLAWVGYGYYRESGSSMVAAVHGPTLSQTPVRAQADSARGSLSPRAGAAETNDASPKDQAAAQAAPPEAVSDPGKTTRAAAATEASTASANAREPAVAEQVPPGNRPVASAPAWVAEGRRLLLAGERERALKVWSEGFAGLPDTTLVVALSLHQDPQGAVARWQQLLEFDGAFVAPGRFRQKNGWWVLLVSDPKNRRADLSVAATRLGLRAGVVQVARLRLPPEGPVQTARAGTDAKQAATSGRESAAKVAVASPQAEAIARDFDAEAVPVLAALERRSSDVIVLADGLVRDFPDRIEPLVWRARAQLLAGQPVDAERTLLEVLSRSPTMVEAWLLRGIAAQERGDHQNALVFFEEALRLAPRNVDALYNIAFSAQQMGDVTRARSAAVKFLSLTQGNPAYANQRSWVEQQLR